MPRLRIGRRERDGELERMREVERHAEEEASPERASPRPSRCRSSTVATVSGRRTATNGGGRADQQLERALPALPLDRAARSRRASPTRSPSGPRRARRRGASPAWLPDSTMKNAIDAKITGCSTETSTKNSEFVRLFRWKSQPIPKRRAVTPLTVALRRTREGRAYRTRGARATTFLRFARSGRRRVSLRPAERPCPPGAAGGP